jgi:uncharacterized ion transporter superfamily protein YfcC
MPEDTSKYEREYNRIRRLLLYLFLLWMPVMGTVMYCTVKRLLLGWVFFSIAFLYMAIALVLSIQCLVAHYRWKHSQ